MILEGFCAGTNTGPARTVNVERLINKVVESDPGTPKRAPVLIDRPCLVPFTNINPGPVSAMLHQDGRFFATSGGFFYEIFQSRNVAVRGEIAVDAKVPTITSNGATAGDQLFITSGGHGYIYELSTNTLTEIDDTDLRTPIWGGAYLDTYFLALNVHSNTFQISDNLDGFAWNGLDVGETTQSSDAKVAMLVSTRKIYLFGTKTTEIWNNTGDTGFPLAPYLDSVVEHGIASPYSAVSFDNTQYWVGADKEGTGLVWRFNGYTPEKVSTYAVDRYLQNLATLKDLIAFSLQWRGHAFFGLYSPHAETTWMYDRGQDVWSEWGHWHPTLLRWRPFIGRCQASGWGKIFVGDRQSGAIYTLSDVPHFDRIKVKRGI